MDTPDLGEFAEYLWDTTIEVAPLIGEGFGELMDTGAHYLIGDEEGAVQHAERVLEIDQEIYDVQYGSEP